MCKSIYTLIYSFNKANSDNTTQNIKQKYIMCKLSFFNLYIFQTNSVWGGRIGAGRFQSASASVPVGPRWAAPPKLWAASCFPAAGTGTCPRTCTPCPLFGLYKIC